MKRLYTILYTILFLFYGTTVFAATYYVRADGGTLSQCSGLVDAPYTGSSSCALKHPHWILGAGNTAGTYSGGDTIIIYGSFKMGYYSGENVGTCSSSWPYSCAVPNIKSGTPSNPTKIVGKTWDSGCSSKSKLYGSGRLDTMFQVSGTSNAEFRCLEITDHSDCVYPVSASHPKDCQATSPYSDDNWTLRGFQGSGSNSQNVLFQDMHIHGISMYGIQMQINKNIVIKDSVIEGISSASPIQFTIGALENPTDPTISLINSTLQYNGCVEEYPIVNSGHEKFTLCCAQGVCGYTTDGIELHSVADSVGNILVEDSEISHHTHDGLDALYGNGSGLVTIRRSIFSGNQGNAIKAAANTIIEDTFVDGRCSYFHATWSGKRCVPDDGCASGGTYCRASGDTIVFAIRKAGQYLNVYNSTFLNEGNIALYAGGYNCDGTEEIISRNNIWVGGDQWDPNANNYKVGDDVAHFYNGGSDGNGAGVCGSGETAPVFDTDYDLWVNFKATPSATATRLKEDPDLDDLAVVIGVDEAATSSWECTNLHDCMDDGGMIPLVGGSVRSFADTTITGIDKYDLRFYDRGTSWDLGALEYDGTEPVPGATFIKSIIIF